MAYTSHPLFFVAQIYKFKDSKQKNKEVFLISFGREGKKPIF